MAVSFVNLVDRADIRMIQRRRRLCFAKEPLFVFLVFEHVGAKEFQGNRALKLRVLGLVDDTHGAPAEFGEDLVVADRFADHDAQLYRYRIRRGNKPSVQLCDRSPASRLIRLDFWPAWRPPPAHGASTRRMSDSSWKVATLQSEPLGSE